MKVGDKVVCVNNVVWHWNNHPKLDGVGPKKDDILTINEIVREGNEYGFTFKERKECLSDGRRCAYISDNFRKLITDHKKSFKSSEASRDLVRVKPVEEGVEEIKREVMV